MTEQKIMLAFDMIDVLKAAAVSVRHRDTFLPYRGMKGKAAKLAKMGLLKEAGHSVQWPHTLYVLTPAGRTALSDTGEK